MPSWKDDSATDSFFGMGKSTIRVPLAVQKALDGRYPLVSVAHKQSCITYQIHAVASSVLLLLKRFPKKIHSKNNKINNKNYQINNKNNDRSNNDNKRINHKRNNKNDKRNNKDNKGNNKDNKQ